MLTLDLQSRVPIYRQIENGIITLILLDVWPEGSRLPSVRSLAAQLNTNPNTVQKAYQELEGWGVIASAAGRGSPWRRPPGRPPWPASAARRPAKSYPALGPKRRKRHD